MAMIPRLLKDSLVLLATVLCVIGAVGIGIAFAKLAGRMAGPLVEFLRRALDVP